jgi:hypothetical protein
MKRLAILFGILIVVSIFTIEAQTGSKTVTSKEVSISDTIDNSRYSLMVVTTTVDTSFVDINRISIVNERKDVLFKIWFLGQQITSLQTRKQTETDPFYREQINIKLSILIYERNAIILKRDEINSLIQSIQ